MGMLRPHGVDRSFRLPSKFSWIYSIKIDHWRREIEDFTHTSPGLSFLPLNFYLGCWSHASKWTCPFMQIFVIGYFVFWLSDIA